MTNGYLQTGVAMPLHITQNWVPKDPIFQYQEPRHVLGFFLPPSPGWLSVSVYEETPLRGHEARTGGCSQPGRGKHRHPARGALLPVGR